MNRYTWRLRFLFLLVWLPSASILAETELLDLATLNLLEDELSGVLAKDHVIAITRHHRVQGSRGYSDAAQYVLQTLRGFGFEASDATIESFRSDGILQYQTWQSPSGWSIENAELRMVEPAEELLVRYPETPMSVITYSNSGRVRAELVDVGSGLRDDEYEGKDVRGKLVLATGYGGDVHRLAVLKYGAAAVICYLDDERAAHFPDMIQYTGMWPRTEELPYVRFGFNLSNRQGRRLKQLLADGEKVVMDSWVDGIGLEPWRMDVVVARIQGTTEQELIYTAHLDHPKASANDNASGSAALLDMARTFKKLIAEGKLPRPKRGLRFLWVPEYYGTMAYIDAHPEVKGPELGGNFLGSLNLDMVGEHLELLHTRLNITWTPPSIAGVITDVTARMASYVDELEATRTLGNRTAFNYRITPFSGGSDHVIFNDGAIRIPAMMLGHWPDPTHHTTEDTPDKVDPVELERCEFIAASTFWFLANVSEKQGEELARLVATNAQIRLVKETEKAIAWLLGAPQEQLSRVYQDSQQVVDFARERELSALRNVIDYAGFETTTRLIDTWRENLEGLAGLQRLTLQAIYYQRAGRFPTPKRLTDVEKEASRWVPKRRSRGPLANGLPQRRLPPAERGWYETDSARSLDVYLLVNLIDGLRTILDLRNDLTAMTQPVALSAVDRLVRDLARTGLVELELRR